MNLLVGKALIHQYKFLHSKAKFPLLLGGYGCMKAGTLIYTDCGLVPIENITPSMRVLSLDHQTGQLLLQPCSGAFPKGIAKMHQVSTPNGKFQATSHHRIFSSDHIYQRLDELSLLAHEDHHKIEIEQISQSHLKKVAEPDQLSLLSNVQHYSQIDADSLEHYGVLARLYGQLLLMVQEACQVSFPLPAYVHEYISESYSVVDGRTDIELKHIHHGLFDDHQYKQDFCHLMVELAEVLVNPKPTLHTAHISEYLQRVQQFHQTSEYHHNTLQRLIASGSFVYPSAPHIHDDFSFASSTPFIDSNVITVSGLEHAEKEPYWDMQVLNTNNYISEDGTIHHNSGKTEALIYRILRFLTEIPKAKLAIYSPTADLSRRIHLPRFEEIFGNSGIRFKLNKTEGIMDIDMPMGRCQIIFRSMDNYSRIIGYETHHAICDEIELMPKEKAMDVWIRVLARNRKKFVNKDGSRGINSVGVTTTPEGFGMTYDLWWKKHRGNPDYELIRAKTVDNYHLPPDYITSLMDTYDPQLILAYLEGQWVNLSGNTVYSGFDRVLSHTDLSIDDFSSSQMLHIGMDFNVGRGSATVGMISPDDSRRMYIVAEFAGIMDTPAMIAAIKSRYHGRIITIYPDASGRSRKSVDASKSDIRLLRDAGFRINAPKKNPPVRERVVNMNTMFLNANGDRNLFINTSTCPNFTEALEKQVYDDNSVPVKDGKYDDLNDSCGYLLNRTHSLAHGRATIARMRFGM